jgi:hypothetical protein
MLGLITAGASPVDAAAAIDIPRRTFREWDQRARGEHPTRRATRELVVLFDDIARAQSGARVHAQVRLHRDAPKDWLRAYATPEEGVHHGASSRGDPGGSRHEMATQEQAVEVMGILVRAGYIKTPRCPDPQCTCADHEPTPPEETDPS